MSVLNQSIIKHKMGLLELAKELNNVSQARRLMGVSRDTSYRVKEAKEVGGMEALQHKDRRRPNLKNRIDETIECAVLVYALDNPAAGRHRVSNELRRRSLFVSSAGVRSIWLRHDLHTFKRRLTYLEKRLPYAERGGISRPRRTLAKVSRPEVAAAFMQPGSCC